MLLYNKRVLKFFRKDGHQWKRKKDGRAIAEAHERLKVSLLLQFVAMLMYFCFQVILFATLDMFFKVAYDVCLCEQVGNVEALQCYYAHGELEPSFQRRIYWILDP